MECRDCFRQSNRDYLHERKRSPANGNDPDTHGVFRRHGYKTFPFRQLFADAKIMPLNGGKLV